jgi:hypothetical protein
MNDQTENERLEAVLDAFVASEGGPRSTSLAEWTHRYPEFARQLTEFAASWSLMRELPPSPDQEEVDQETLVLRGMSIVQNLLHRQERPQVAAATSITSLLADGRAHGLAPRQVAQRARLTEVLLRKLDRRLIRFGTIPVQAIDALAASIHRDMASVVIYLQQAPTFAVAAKHRAEQAPQLAAQEDFFDAVRNDATMSDELRAQWLALAPPDHT